MDENVMVVYNSNAQQVVGSIAAKIYSVTTPKGADNDKMLRVIASTLTGVMHKRVHVDGLAADGSKIGTYTPAYMRVRSGLYANSKVQKSGKGAGKVISAGTFTKKRVNYVDFSGGLYSTGETKHRFEKITDGAERPKYNRGIDRTVILSLTKQMENDLLICEASPIQTSYGYAIGYQNEFNYQKAIWNEEKYHKKILTELSRDEQQLASDIANKTTTDDLNK